ncbi:hypothetical protein KKF81_00145 [Candidatus Micrarchaeota archaeon]|nr:hypothetical protein [Candidatus Micrarchaeota archaeon]MBU1165327.1 hypothetical protein [Candidatus Micrarchaeota archaeon]MBU1886769.1 hypothetical protein [Candidatus Micrarchaeota archaeon]
METGVDEKMPILKKNRMATGISDLDIMLEGGYTNPANIILIGPNGTEKAALAYHFISAVAANENAYIVCGNSSPNDIAHKASGLGINLNKDNVRFIDCYTATLGKGEQADAKKVRVVDGPSALNDISLAINEALKESEGKRIKMVFDTLSTFVLYNQKDSIRKFLGVIGGRLKSAQATTLYLVDDGVHDKQLISLIEHGMDETYTINENGGKYSMTLPNISSEIPIKIGPTGIVIV